MQARHQRILHIDGDSFFASCEIALDSDLKGKPVFVGGGRRGDGIVIAANYLAKKFGIITGMACFEAKHKCPDGVLVRPHYDEYRRLSLEIFRRARHYTPLLVPTSIDEGFLDFTDSPAVFRCRTPADLIIRMRRELTAEVGVPVSMGLGSSRWLAKLATEHCKPDNFHEVPEDEAQEREFLRDIPVQKLAGIAKRRALSLRALGIWTLGDVAHLPLGLLEKRYGFFGLELWLLANGRLHERLALADKPRTCIGSATTLPYDEPDYDTALLFLLDQTERTVTTFFRENLKAREMGVYVRFKNMEGNGASVKFPVAQFEPHRINPHVERLFRELVAHQEQPIRQVCINFWNMQPLELEPDMFNNDVEYKRRELHHALETIEARYGKRRVKTGTRLLLEKEAAYLVGEKPKCPFIPQREMEIKMDNIPEPLLDLVYEDEWQPLELTPPAAPLPLPRTWGRSTSRTQKFL
ncbi:MAG TPA: DNA polymerase IV [Verrucomicrobiae bacterium]|nr:DNA polymerase IV [Verrucomicrobiae bacterium]